MIAERFHFHKREQLKGKCVTVYSAALKKCSEHCLRYIFKRKPSGTDSSVAREADKFRRLLAEKSLTWKTAVEMALATEVADKQANNFRNSPADSGIHYAG